jgi:putative spermidine/putrescine transport system permease protein
VSDLYALPLPRGVFRVYMTLMLAFLIMPALIVVPVSFSAGSIIAFPLPGFSTRWYAEAVQSIAWRNAVENSLIIGLGAALLATALGLSGALGIDRLSRRLRSPALILSLFPFVVPVILIALGGYLALAALGLNNTYVGIIVLHAAMGVPFVVISVTASLQGFDRNLLRAAAGLGASPAVAFRRIMLPMILPGVLTGAVFAFAVSLDEVVVASFVTSPTQRTLPLLMFAGIKENTGPIVTSVATLLLLLAGCFLVCVEALQRRSERLRSPVGQQN